MGKKYVIFDIDGTLNQTHLYGVEAYERALSKRGIQADRREILSCFGLSPKAIVERFFGILEKQELDSWKSDIEGLEYQLMKENAHPFEGVEEALNELKAAGFKLAICSNAFPTHISNVLNALGLADYFDEIGSLEMGKDKREIVSELMKRTRCSHACMVGDRIFDMEAAAANGIPMVGCAYGYAPEEVMGATIVVKSPFDIAAAVKSLL